ncbi:MAG: PilZ domain-containing protein [Pseudomonadota bacterium]
MRFDRREHDRFPVYFSVTYSDGVGFIKEFVYDISKNGLQIRSRKPCQPGMRLKMTIETPLNIKAEGTVVRMDKKQLCTIGVQLDPMKSDTATKWQQLLSPTWTIEADKKWNKKQIERDL